MIVTGDIVLMGTYEKHYLPRLDSRDGQRSRQGRGGGGDRRLWNPLIVQDQRQRAHRAPSVGVVAWGAGHRRHLPGYHGL